MSNSIKEKQAEAVERMLNFNKALDSKETWEEPWKILIYDSFCRDIIAPLLRVGGLRKHGVTLHMLLHSDRQPIPDVPAIYFVLPTKENVKRICEDCKKHLYDNYHLNFASSIPRSLLEEIATCTLECDTVHQISKVCDQFLNFISLEKDLVSFGQKNSYIEFNDPTLSDNQAEQNIESTVEALFSSLATMGVVPIIRCPKNGAAEAIATQLDTKLHDHLINMGNMFSESTISFQRPVLIILDRNIDLSVMLHHTWTYQALVHDLLGMNLNRVQLEVQEIDESNNNNNNSATKPKEIKTYDFDSSDAFWSQNSGTAFTNIAVAVNTYLKEYKNSLDDFNKMSGGVDIDNYDESQLLGKTKDIGSFVNQIPALREKKRIIDVHTNIATALLKQIKARELDTFFSLEESMMTRTFQDKKELLALMSDPKRGTPEDKLRLLLIYIMSNEHISQSDMEQFEEALTKVGIDTSVTKYIKRTKAFNETLSTGVSQSPSSSSSKLGGLLNKVNVDQFGLGGSLSKQLGTLFTAGVKALLPATKELYITRIVDAIMEMKSDLGVDNYLYFDPKIQKKMRQTSIPRKNTPFKEAMVFVVGGGNYVEYLNLQDYAKKVPAKKIIYGCSELLNSSQFLNQLNQLSKK